MQRMGGQDAAFLYGETASWHMQVSALMTVDPSTAPGGFDFERLKALTVARLPIVPQFRWKLVDVPFGLDRPGWVEEEDFDPDFHIRRIAVPEPGGPRELGELVGRLASCKLDRRKPLWEMWVIEGVEHGRVAILTKMHHSIIDGVSGMGLAEAILDLEPDPPPRPDEVRDSLHDRRVPSPIELLVTGAFNMWTWTPYRMMRFGRQSVRQGLSAAGFFRRSVTPVTPFQAPRTSLNGELTPHRRFAWASVPLASVKDVKNSFDVKLNDVVLAALCAGALRRYLQKLDDLPDQPLIAQCPVSLRTDADRDDVGSKVGSMFTSLATDIADPALRLVAIHESTQNAKEIQQALSVHKIMGLTETTPPGLIALAARTYTGMGLGRMPPPVNLVISNVPGPPFPLFLAGARLEAMYPMGPLMLGMGLNITVISYRESLDFGFMCCPEMVPQPEFIAEGIPLALAELEAARTS